MGFVAGKESINIFLAWDLYRHHSVGEDIAIITNHYRHIDCLSDLICLNN